MVYRLLADSIVILHFLFIVFALLGGFLFFWRKWTILLHLPTAIWICVIEFGGWICPLTPLENRLRLAGGAAGYKGEFVEHYLIPIIYPPDLTRSSVKSFVRFSFYISVNSTVTTFCSALPLFK